MTLPDHIVRKLNLEAELEQAIDAHGLEHVVELIAGICFAKCEHIKHNWQDLAKEWERAGGSFSAALEQAARVSRRR